MNNLSLVLGGPGCGKTTRLLEIVEREMAAGVPATAIAFVTFTKAAATEAKDRAAERFGLNAETDLPWFRTIHSLAYAKLGLQKDEVMDRRDWVEFGTVVGETMTGSYSPSEAPAAPSSTREIGDSMLRVIDYAATTLMPLERAWHALDEVVEWHRLRRFADALTAYKADADKIDFSDMLRHYIESGAPVDVEVAVIDEAQDLTAAQWAAVRRAFGNAKRVYVGGDDDQAIYHWAGADVAQFLTLTTTPEILPNSHRLPRVVHAFAETVAARISSRYRKRFTPSAREGTISWHQHPEGIDFGTGSWYLLARNTYMLNRLEALVREEGYNYRRRGGSAVKAEDVRQMQLWERLRTGKLRDMSAKELKALRKALGLGPVQTRELHRYTVDDLGVPAETFNLPWFRALTGIEAPARDYYQQCLRRGDRLTQPPRITIETIHGVKGLEADHVLLMTDLSHRTARGYRTAPDSEHRVFYVGLTRALQSLHIILPQSDLFYPLA